MRGRSTMLRIGLGLVLAALAAGAQAGAPPGSAKENRSLADQLEPNWNVPTGSACHRVVGTRIFIAPDGRVTGAEPAEPMPADDPCRAIVESLRRAALLSSPLWFPPGQTPASVVVRFDPEKFEAYY